MKNRKAESPRPEWLLFSNRYKDQKEHCITMAVPINVWMGEQFPEREKVGKQAYRYVPQNRMDSCPYLRGKRQLWKMKKLPITEYFPFTSYCAGWHLSFHYPGHTLDRQLSAPCSSLLLASCLSPLPILFSLPTTHHWALVWEALSHPGWLQAPLSLLLCGSC